MNANCFDERQLQARGQIFFHGFASALALILCNAFLQESGVVWASPFNQNLLIGMLAVTVVSIESLVRGVYFGRQKTPWRQIGLFGVASVVLTGICLRNLLQGAALVENSALSAKGAALVFDGMFLATTLVALAQVMTERRKNRA
ncbi:MAG: hypothetical protein LBH86_04510 [Oscillospiraceae bacterium]|jgi:hypothetical protein|nr:hypothetical protein [Oscillospiraceae bacterium]